MNKTTFISDGKTKVFYFTFPFFLKTDVVIEVDSQPATNYNLICTKNGLNADVPFSGGEVHFTKPPKTGSVISIWRNLPVKRIVDYQETAPYSPKTHNHDMNYIVEIIKDLGAKIEEFTVKYAEITDKESVSTATQQIAQLMSAITSVDNEIAQLNDTGTISAIQSNLTALGNFKNDVLDYVVARQLPTANNNYTWYRKYKSGWIEQGGIVTNIGINNSKISIFPVAMASNDYAVALSVLADSYNISPEMVPFVRRFSTTQIEIKTSATESGDKQINARWLICGMAA